MYARYSKMVDGQRNKQEVANSTGDRIQQENECLSQKEAEACGLQPDVQTEPAASEEKAHAEEKGSDETNNAGSTDAEKEEKKILTLDELWQRLCDAPPECHSLLKKNLTQEIFDELKDKTSAFRGRLEDCIRSGKLSAVLNQSRVTPYGEQHNLQNSR
ncbi:hypothetical protein RRG08_005085 [Elysia crispata]|uniref:Phosphagen kinase N-terminal domain-containing protein n=1 Tax=Elysia crispata TaxID=231223 RepID=A0AAE0XYJ9_9GAST|nr:hypothetical protein RRG08_005085 [Elysia crispata]